MLSDLLGLSLLFKFNVSGLKPSPASTPKDTGKAWQGLGGHALQFPC